MERTDRWARRPLPEDLRQHYVGRGVVDRRHASATMVADGLADLGAHRVPGPLRRSTRGGAPSPTSTGPPASLAASLAGPGRRARVGRRPPAAELGRGRHRLLGRGLPRRRRRARRPLLRAQGGRLHPAVDRAPTWSSPPTASATSTTWPTTRRSWPTTPGPGGWWRATRRPTRSPPGPRPSPPCSTPSRWPGRAASTPTPRRSSASPRARPGTRRASCTPTARSASRPASSTTCSPRAARPRSPAPPSATSSGCSTPSWSRCCGSGRSTWSTSGTRARSSA